MIFMICYNIHDFLRFPLIVFCFLMNFDIVLVFDSVHNCLCLSSIIFDLFFDLNRYTCVYMYMHVYTCIYMYTHVCTCIYLYIHVHIYIYMYIHTYIHVYTSFWNHFGIIVFA